MKRFADWPAPSQYRPAPRQIPHLRTESLSMFSQLMNFLKAPETAKPADLKIAVAVLLLEAAYRDDSFSSEERAVIARLLRDRFGLSKEEASQLMAATESKVRQMVQLHPYTHAIFEQMPPEERIGFIEMLWEVAYADGVLDPEEDAMIRKIAGPDLCRGSRPHAGAAAGAGPHEGLAALQHLHDGGAELFEIVRRRWSARASDRRCCGRGG